MEIPEGLDHLVYVTSRLEETVVEIGHLLSVAPAAGGQHPSWGTRNALLALGPRAYLELMAPDPGLPSPGSPRPFGMDGLERPRLATWVMRTEDIDAVVATARQMGVELGNPEQRSRRRPDGTELRWTMTDLFRDRAQGIVPYFIDWGDSPHPAQGAPTGCMLVSLELFHPEARQLNELFEALGIAVRVAPGPVGLKAVIETPGGARVLD